MLHWASWFQLSVLLSNSLFTSRSQLDSFSGGWYRCCWFCNSYSCPRLIRASTAGSTELLWRFLRSKLAFAWNE